MGSSEGDSSPSGATRSSSLVPAVAFAIVIVVALVVFFVLRQVLPPASTATPTQPAKMETVTGGPGEGITAGRADGVTPSAPAAIPSQAATAPAATATPLPATPSPQPPATPVVAATATRPAATVAPTGPVASPTAAGTASPEATPTPRPAVTVYPPVALGVPPIVYSFYDWQNTDFAQTLPAAGPVGSLAYFGWNKLHTGPNQYNWSAIDSYLAQAAGMTVTLQNGTVISKPVILEIVENLSEPASTQIAQSAGKDALSARFVYHDYTPDFVRQQISATLTRPITYTLPDGSMGTLKGDGGSYLAEVGPATGCVTKTVAFAPKYDNATWQKYYKEFLAALGARYDKNTQIVAVVFGPGIDQEYGQATKDYQGCGLRAQLYKAMPEAAYLDVVVKAGANNDLADAWRAAFPSKPLYFQFTASGKDRVETLASANYQPAIGLKQATLVYDNANQWQSNGRGTLQLMSTYSASMPIAWENALANVGTGPAAVQNRYFTILSGLSSFPAWMDFNGWIKELSADAPWVLDFARTYLGRSLATTDEVWLAMRGTEFVTPTVGAVTYTGWPEDAAYGLRRLDQAPLVRREQLASAPFSLPAATLDHPFALMARRSDIANGVNGFMFGVDRGWPFWKQTPQSMDANGVWYDVTIKYLDAGTDSFAIAYQDASGTTQRQTITKKNTQAWVTTTLTLLDAYLAGGLAGGADLLLDAGEGDEIVHMVMIKGHAAAPAAQAVSTAQIIDRADWVARQIAERATATAIARLPGVLPTPTLTKSLWLPTAPVKEQPPAQVAITPPGRPTISPAFYAYYDWRNTDFGSKYPDFPAIGSQVVFGWNEVQTGPNQYNWQIVDTFLNDAANMTVTLASGQVISKPVILEFVQNLSEIYSTQYAHDPDYANYKDVWAARFVWHDYTPQFVKNAIAAPLPRPITYANTAGQIVTLTSDGGSYLVDVVPGAGSCVTRTVGISPKYNNATWQMYYKQFITAAGQRYNNNPVVTAFTFGPGIDEEFGAPTKHFHECAVNDNPWQSAASYMDTIVKAGITGDLLDTARAAFPDKPVLLQFTGMGKDRSDIAMQSGYAFPVGMKQATITQDNYNQWQSNDFGTIQIMQRYSQTTYIAWENAYAYTGPEPKGSQTRYQTLLAALSTFPSYMDFIGSWYTDWSLLDAGVLQFTQEHFGRSAATTQDVWIALRDTDYYPPTTGGTLSFGGWHDDWTFGLHRKAEESGINNPVIKQAAMGAAPYSVPTATLNHIYSYIARRTDNASGNNTMSFYVEPRWTYFNQPSQSQNAANGAWFDVSVKYLDIGTDTFSLSYMTPSGATRTNTITKTNTRAWKTASVVLFDAVMANRMALGADLILNSDPQNGGLDEIVHMVQILGHRGAGPTPTPSWSPTPKPTRTASRTPLPGSPTPTFTRTPTGSRTPAATASPFSEIRVNGGGPTYVDSAGKTWLADQPFATGSWGWYASAFVGTYASTLPVSGTADSQLYQTERYFKNGAGSFIFTVPNGNYEVELRFAEIFGREPGQRVFDVSLNDTPVLQSLDLSAQVGKNVAYNRTFQTNVTGGQIVVNFVPISDSAKIGALRVTLLGAPPTATATRTVTPGGPTATRTATRTFTPTATATRTAVPGASTATPSPTATRTPAATATPGPGLEGRVDDLERRYQNLYNLVNRLLEILKQFGGVQ